jgi:hypothetical protein
LVVNGGGQVGGQVEDEFAMHDHVVVGLFQVSSKHLCEGGCQRGHERRISNGEHGKHTISTSVQVDDIAYANIDHTKEALILLLELLLVEYLDSQDTVFGDSATMLLSI